MRSLLGFGAPVLVPLHNGGVMGRQLRAYAGAPPVTGGFPILMISSAPYCAYTQYQASR